MFGDCKRAPVGTFGLGALATVLGRVDCVAWQFVRCLLICSDGEGEYPAVSLGWAGARGVESWPSFEFGDSGRVDFHNK